VRLNNRRSRLHQVTRAVETDGRSIFLDPRHLVYPTALPDKSTSTIRPQHADNGQCLPVPRACLRDPPRLSRAPGAASWSRTVHDPRLDQHRDSVLFHPAPGLTAADHRSVHPIGSRQHHGRSVAQCSRRRPGRARSVGHSAGSNFRVGWVDPSVPSWTV